MFLLIWFSILNTKLAYSDLQPIGLKMDFGSTGIMHLKFAVQVHPVRSSGSNQTELPVAVLIHGGGKRPNGGIQL